MTERLVGGLAEQISKLAPITLLVPTSPIFQLSRFVHHVTSTPVHPVYFPYLRFGVIHAVRVTLVWAVLTKGKTGKKGRLQDLFGYLVMAWGGGTAVDMLLNRSPSWLVSPTPWIIYPAVYTLLVPTGLSSYFVSTCPSLLLNVGGAFVDGMTRGTTITSLSSVIPTTALGQSFGVWTYALLSAVAVSFGGVPVGLLGLAEPEWKLGVPTILNGGLLGTMDAWGAALVGIVWLILTRQAQVLAPISDAVLSALPKEFKSTLASQGLDKQTIDVGYGRAICVLLLGSLLATRAVILSLRGRRLSPGVTKKTELTILDEKGLKEVVVKSPVATRAEGQKLTPRKSPRVKSKHP
ncbi:hypothetical protein IAU60_001577 [Kwoniella sp. DSM 27419]